ncbi:MAG: MBL fold metallo-hydrolase, partial [Symbiobacteriaceae bacterium]
MQLWYRALGSFGANCYIVACEETRQALVIDPGVPDPWIQSCVTENNLTVAGIVLTHGHADHVGDAVAIAQRTGALIVAPVELANWISKQGAPRVHGMNFGGSRPFGF